MKHYEVTYPTPNGGTAHKEYDADHYSVSSNGPVPIAHFYRQVPFSQDKRVVMENGRPKDELVGSVVQPLTVSEDDKSVPLDVVAEALSEDAVEELEAKLGVKIPDAQQLRIVVSLA